MVLEKTATMDPYELGRRLSVAVRADDARLVMDRIEKQTRKTAPEERKITLALINANITDGNMAGMLVGIHAFQEHIEDEVREAYEDARLLAERFPLCVQLTELCAGRDQQLQQLPIMWAQIASAFSDVKSASGSRDEWLMGCWAGFFEGFTAVTIATATVQASILSRGQAVLASGSGGYGSGVAQGAAISVGSVGGTGVTTKLVSFAPGTASGAGTGGNVSVGAGRTDGSAGNKCKLEVNAPLSKDILGDVIGLDGPGVACWECGTQGHYKGECALAWGRLGRPLPGWDKNGKKKPGDWNKAEPKRKTYGAWVKFLEDVGNFPAGGAEFLALTDAPDLDRFKERARSAPL